MKNNMAKEPIVDSLYNELLRKQYDGEPREDDKLTLHNVVKLVTKCENINVKDLAQIPSPPIAHISQKLNEINTRNFLSHEVTWLQIWLETQLTDDKYNLVKEHIDLDDLFAQRYARKQTITNPNHVKKLYEQTEHRINANAKGLIQFALNCEGETETSLATKKKPPITNLGQKINLSKKQEIRFSKEDTEFLHNWLVTTFEDDKYSKLDEKQKPSPDHIAELLIGNLAKRADPETLNIKGVSPAVLANQEQAA